MAELEEQIKVVAEFRKDASELIERKSNALDKWEVENATLIEDTARIKQNLFDAEAELRELTLQAYADTGNKTPVKGVGIREVIKLAYDADDAFKWATEHKMALKLDVSGFEKIAKVTPHDFVTITKEPQATIATNLEA